MADRVLNFSEFQGKYSEETSQDAAASLSDFSTSSDNFADGFDETTYEEKPIGPKRPISDGESTPAQPGENGAPKFNPDSTSGVELPGEDAEGEEDLEDGEEINPTYGEYDFEDGGNPEDDDEEDEEDEDESEEDEDESEDEEEDDANESRSWKSNRVLVESFDDFAIDNQSQPREYDRISDEIELIDFSEPDDIHHAEDDDDECYTICKSCGSKKKIEAGDKPYGTMNQMDPDSWWQGSKMGMQCGCNM
jgi:hypothetical protein